MGARNDGVVLSLVARSRSSTVLAQAPFSNNNVLLLFLLRFTLAKEEGEINKFSSEEEV